MKREEKIEMIQEIIEKKDPYIGLYAELLLSMGDMKLNTIVNNAAHKS